MRCFLVGSVSGARGVRSCIEQTGFAEVAGRLIAHLDGEDDGHISDIKAIDAWATELGVLGLYDWRHKDDLLKLRNQGETDKRL